MGAALLILLLAVPLAELWVIVQVADRLGIAFTLVALFGVSIAGAWLLKREGTAAWRRLRDTLRRGEMPAKHLVDGALIIFGGALLLTPGFITDVVGLLLVAPVTRPVAKRAGRAVIGWVAMRRFGAAGAAATAGRRVYETRARRARAERGEPPPRDGSIEETTARDARAQRGASGARTASEELPPEARRDDAGGSPDRA